MTRWSSMQVADARDQPASQFRMGRKASRSLAYSICRPVRNGAKSHVVACIHTSTRHLSAGKATSFLISPREKPDKFLEQTDICPFLQRSRGVEELSMCYSGGEAGSLTAKLSSRRKMASCERAVIGREGGAWREDQAFSSQLSRDPHRTRYQMEIESVCIEERRKEETTRTTRT